MQLRIGWRDSGSAHTARDGQRYRLPSHLWELGAAITQPSTTLPAHTDPEMNFATLSAGRVHAEIRLRAKGRKRWKNSGSHRSPAYPFRRPSTVPSSAEFVAWSGYLFPG